ncbi:hypothetical protein Tfer_2399 [Thermincola ferriacetica]|uniref:Uncharacterized protein n=1 Tax=Thermincola ferriacetica TaxID=281456 RepID=A0A0L6W0D4_9FIRM|nr:hypothetical protein [Thermincola ferriacetica]KNZ68911.1 hypothetical protein Tfer_2399 [Thermincola ferriacetica]
MAYLFAAVTKILNSIKVNELKDDFCFVQITIVLIFERLQDCIRSIPVMK